jgi:hypothetical protein
VIIDKFSDKKIYPYEGIFRKPFGTNIALLGAIFLFLKKGELIHGNQQQFEKHISLYALRTILALVANGADRIAFNHRF